MRKEIEIHGNKSLILSVGLIDVLSHIIEGNKLYWSILWLEATGNLKEMTVLELEKRVNESSNGYSISWENLILLSKSFDQVIELFLIGDKESSKLKRYTTDEEAYQNCDLCIELVDSSYWVIHSSDIYIDNLINNLPGVKVL